ncbi:UNKNOWN [Stylonychia lemnae]|uniref:Uncharacterized protein n=1 Tax=Stylonychia lemnae TaxID=5949 RepID=A0A078B328_STYLE|nr:UNKNOWN [Stylonychia lemnae]|eukprot:CDW87652.1 UNKNOWN [Stylonychia lemnae]
MKKIQLLLLLSLGLLNIIHHVSAKGKTYEDVAKLMQENHQLHLKDDDESAVIVDKKPQSADNNQNKNPNTPASQPNNKQNQQTQQTNNNKLSNPPTYSTHDIMHTNSVPLNQVFQPPQQETKNEYKREDVDDPQSLGHTKFHIHGPANEKAEKERAKQVVSDFEKKKKTNPDSRVQMKGVNFQKTGDQKDKFYFLLTTVVLTLTSLLIVGACFGSIYFFYKLTFGNRERYFQFDENNNDIEKAERKGTNLSKIDEDPLEEFDTSIVKAAKLGATEVSNRSSITRPTQGQADSLKKVNEDYSRSSTKDSRIQ